MNPLDELRARGFLESTTDDATLDGLLGSARESVYVGFDPTADSLHVGHLLPIVALTHFQRAGHRPILLVGGATGMIGDPSGRSSERNLLTVDQLEKNVEGIRTQVARFLDPEGESGALVVNNADWIGPITHLDWLRDVGKHFTIPYMLAKESVRSRLDQGVSYTEFSYMLLQAYDFLHLFRELGCRIQAGGSEQWGNITAGIDFIRRVEGQQAYGITFRLLTTRSGEKFGKSAGNAVWLSEARTSPFAFHQYWFNSEDADVASLLRLFTFLEIAAIEDLMREHVETPDRRQAQSVLADEVTRFVHGAAGLERARRAKSILFDTRLEHLTAADIEAAIADLPVTTIAREEIGRGLAVDQALVRTSLASSRAEARRLIDGGGVSLNGKLVGNARASVSLQEAIGPYVLLRAGKRRPAVIVIES